MNQLLMISRADLDDIIRQAARLAAEEAVRNFPRDRPDGVLIFKWCEDEIPVSRILELTPERPLFGHKSGKQQKTHWVTFMKPNAEFSGRPKAGPLE